MVFELLKARRGRKAAVALIAPLVEHSRRNGTQEMSEGDWFTPYMVGFMAMLITLVAERATGGLSSDAIGTVQADAWQDITGCDSVTIGEEICLLSTASNPDFERGCAGARRFLSTLERSAGQLEPDATATGHERHRLEFDPSVALLLWAEYFDAHLGGSTNRSH